ncbi:1,4-alpha-glucan branching enzyme [Halothiobacillus diazotrophicus]|uniref:1,4-alpha-glucan branching enzyme GlgB n=1 Tax=Halothiobacillus diazotrophicus TaxID=1860122 RepID=A0A191ZE82_9GAMM|nr:1,4-alpha-glucan branching protein GlgB [Halothiobacillus diazotrophicus]ANJ66178.1 1,4-alpha-glucan branching enzyme [Halothiobacillus diazotrophicus]
MTLDLQALLEARLHDPFALLGRHPISQKQGRFHTFQPQARQVWLLMADGQATPLSPDVRFPGVFHGEFPLDGLPDHPTLRIEPRSGATYEIVDPYSFAPTLGDMDLYLFGEGKHYELWKMMGAHPATIDQIDGVRFAVWAPNAERVSVVGDFNNWDGRRHPMRVRGSSGVWELFIPGLKGEDLYKFEIRNRANGSISVRTDPMGRHFEHRPKTAAKVTPPSAFPWTDEAWLSARTHRNWFTAPMNIYEVHLGSWRMQEGRFLSYTEAADQLIPYVQERGFTHIELLPITEHPFDGSWGYQTTGYFAPTSRFGTPDEFRYFVNRAHEAGIGIILDWVPAHFPRDEFALAKFDGTALYEHEDPRRGEHRDWGTLIFNYGRNEVRNFLIASALYWIEEMHLDGLRVDAVASMLYLDYSRNHGDWLPNAYGGRENLEAIDFLRQLNHVTQSRNPGALVMAEESTAWPLVSRPPEVGGLGFSLKWNMGWMNDTLRYFQEDPINRQYHHNNLTFGLLYCFTENFILPLSHDEVVHGKGSLLNKMPGDEWQRFANLRLLLAYQYTYPGKKLLFMGNEFGQGNEWSHERPLDWWVCQYAFHQGIDRLTTTLSHCYRNESALHERDFEGSGFEWNDCNDRQNSIISYLRHSEESTLLTILNFTPVVRQDYRIGIPMASRMELIVNTDDETFGGSGHDIALRHNNQIPSHGKASSIDINLPALSAIIIKIR